MAESPSPSRLHWNRSAESSYQPPLESPAYGEATNALFNQRHLRLDFLSLAIKQILLDTALPRIIFPITTRHELQPPRYRGGREEARGALRCRRWRWNLNPLYKELGVNWSLTLIGPPHASVRRRACPGREGLTPLQPGVGAGQPPLVSSAPGALFLKE